MNHYRNIFYAIGISAFTISFFFTLFFAYKAMQFDQIIEKKTKAKKTNAHYVLISEELNNEYWRLVEKGAKAAGRRYHVSIEYNGPLQSNLSEHMKLIDMAISSKVDGIITQGLSEEKFTPLINKAMKKGIPVITVDTDAAKSKRVSYVGTDNYRSGYLAGKALIAGTKGKAVVGIITGSFEASHQKLRVEGFKDAIKNKPGIKVVDIKASNITKVQAAEKANEILSEHPDVNAFYGTSALDGLGIAQVIKRQGHEKKIYIISFDTLPETLQLMKQGFIQATVVQKPYKIGYESVKLMHEFKKGRHIPSTIHTDTGILYQKDIAKGDVSP